METRFQKLNTKIPFKNQLEDWKNNSKSKEVAEQIKKENEVKALWVKKLIKTKDWNTFYKNSPGYTFLEYVKGEGIMVAFVVGNINGNIQIIPTGCEKLTKDEMIIVDEQRRGINCLPTIFEKSKIAISQK